MKVIKLKPGSPCEGGNTVVALGFFDGVHLGHRRLFHRVLTRAAELGAVPAVFTFSDDIRLFKPDTVRLTDFETKMELFRECGMETVYVADFPSFSGLTPEEFVKEVLVGTIGCKQAVCGFNFRFGKNATGDGERLVSLMREAGRDADIIPATVLDGKVISSSEIRSALAEGDVELASAMLGHSYTLAGTVGHGRGYGHTVGVPTVNLLFPPHIAVPKHGVYVSRTVLEDGRCFRSVSNVGTRPTFGGEDVNCETFLLDYKDGELYGAKIKVEFLYFLRPERKFNSPDELYKQINIDIESAKND